MRRSLTITLILYCVCAFAQAQYTDKVLFAAYLRNDMTVWDSYLHHVSFHKQPLAEQERYINYEYGYVATAIDEKAPDMQQHIDSFEHHINYLDGKLPKATILDYRSSLAAYEALVNKLQFLTKGLESFNLVKEAYATDSLNPLVLSLKGNVDFYAPKAFGGNKQRALGYFRTAQRLYEAAGDTLTTWGYCSTRLCIIQCEEKLGDTNRALRDAEALLRKFPTFAYLRDQYLPELRRKYQKSSK